jgi:Cdc6-like AAA superfamily ATPase
VCTLAGAGELFERVSQRASMSFDRKAFENAIVELRARVEDAVDSSAR